MLNQPQGRGPGSLIPSMDPVRERHGMDRHSGSRLTRRKRSHLSALIAVGEPPRTRRVACDEKDTAERRHQIPPLCRVPLGRA